MRKTWWKEAVAYQIYPRSFCDSNGDGIGDLQGIISKLDYLEELGIGLVWLSPIYPSPNDDNGYDVADYQGVAQEFGSMADFDLLLEQLHRRGIRLIMDFVANHTSDEHPWFRESRKSRDNPYRDWYIWRPGKDGREPNNWESIFRGSAWELDEGTGDYYLHLFSKKQPDLNWENPSVRTAIYRAMRWWLDKGVDGFRLDAINYLSKVPGLPDAASAGAGSYADAMRLCAMGPRLHEYLNEMKREVFDHYDIFTVGEASLTTVDEAASLTHEEHGSLNSLFHFEHTILDIEPGDRASWKPRKLDIGELKRVLGKWQIGLEGTGWNAPFFGNHDLPRAVSRFGDDNRYRAESAKLIATILLTLKGTPFIYQGDEIGMTNARFASIDDYRDVATLNMYNEYRDAEGMHPNDILPLAHRYSRDNARTPMHWTGGPHAGFSSVQPWIGINDNHEQINVERERQDRNSVLQFYKSLIALRKQYAVLVYGEFQAIDDAPRDVFAFARFMDGTRIVVLGNFSRQETLLEMNQSSAGKLLLGNYCGNPSSKDGWILLRPFESRVYVENT